MMESMRTWWVLPSSRYGFPADESQLFLRNRQEFAHIETHAEYGERAAQHAVLHIEFDGEVGNVVFRQVHLLFINKDFNFAEIERIDGFAEIFRVAVFPPATRVLSGNHTPAM